MENISIRRAIELNSAQEVENFINRTDIEIIEMELNAAPPYDSFKGSVWGWALYKYKKQVPVLSRVTEKAQQLKYSMIKEIITESPIDINADNWCEEIEKVEDSLDESLKFIGYKVYRLNTYRFDSDINMMRCNWLILPINH